jgi:predicted transposase YdaD
MIAKWVSVELQRCKEEWQELGQPLTRMRNTKIYQHIKKEEHRQEREDTNKGHKMTASPSVMKMNTPNIEIPLVMRKITTSVAMIAPFY